MIANRTFKMNPSFIDRLLIKAVRARSHDDELDASFHND